MGHLIPLMLEAFPRPPSSPPTRTKSSPSTSPPTVLLLIIPTLPTLANPCPVEPMVPDAIPTKSQQRLRTPPRPRPVTDLIIMPYTQREWRKVMEEVRVLYLKRQYRQCSARCIQVLDGVEDPYRVHPLYSIYLCFYAGTCLELTARSLNVNSSDKIPLLQSSLQYYDQAESYMEYATFSADPTIISVTREKTNAYQSTPSSSSSLRSSIDSIFSQSSSVSSTAENSPTSSTFSVEPAQQDIFATSSAPAPAQLRPRTLSDPEGLRPEPLRLKKKVSFSLPADVSSNNQKHDYMPTSTRTVSAPTPIRSSSSTPTSTLKSDSDENCNLSTISTHLLSRSLTRYRTHLNHFSTQLTYHRTTITTLITNIQNSRKARRSNTAEIFTDFPHRIMDIASEFSSFRDYGDSDGNEEVVEGRDEAKRKDLEERVKKLKERGWCREHFSEERRERIERLCEKALRELE